MVLFVCHDAFDDLILPSLSLLLAFLDNPLNTKEQVLLKKLRYIDIFLKSVIMA